MKKNLYAKIREDLYWAIKDVAYLQRRTLASVIEDAIRLYLEQIGNELGDIEIKEDFAQEFPIKKEEIA